jgi:hypothetical protein
LKKYFETNIFKMPAILIANIFAMFDGHVFQQPGGIPMFSNCAPPLANLFFYSHKVDFMKTFLKKNGRK